ncbi:ROK family protein [Sphingomonas sp.]|uniref:ROK family protein n=1 Tax=Sphingomonas sp. TaxID=28214 RepID=UPI002ED8E347
MTLFGAIEAGGTKFVCGVGGARAGSRARAVIATTDPAATLAEVGAFFDRALEAHGPLDAIGLGSFGPLELDPKADRYGQITTTPKPGWSGVDIGGWLRARYGIPVAIDTDVNAAALAEADARGVSSLAYATVGTGIGVGLVLNGTPHLGTSHPEAGHIPVRRHEGHSGFTGICPYHGDCLEGLASGPAIKAAWGASLDRLPADHPAWAIEADYIGQLCASLILMVSPGTIVLGGGVMQQARLLNLVRAAALRQLGGYCPQWEAAAAERISMPLSGEAPGLTGAYLLAERLAGQRDESDAP